MGLRDSAIKVSCRLVYADFSLSLSTGMYTRGTISESGPQIASAPRIDAMHLESYAFMSRTRIRSSRRTMGTGFSLQFCFLVLILIQSQFSLKRQLKRAASASNSSGQICHELGSCRLVRLFTSKICTSSLADGRGVCGTQCTSGSRRGLFCLHCLAGSFRSLGCPHS